MLIKFCNKKSVEGLRCSIVLHFPSLIFFDKESNLSCRVTELITDFFVSFLHSTWQKQQLSITSIINYVLINILHFFSSFFFCFFSKFDNNNLFLFSKQMDYKLVFLHHFLSSFFSLDQEFSWPLKHTNSCWDWLNLSLTFHFDMISPLVKFYWFQSHLILNLKAF